jgi:hypothetical protein
MTSTRLVKFENNVVIDIDSVVIAYRNPTSEMPSRVTIILRGIEDTFHLYDEPAKAFMAYFDRLVVTEGPRLDDPAGWRSES